ncbi:hypothetical protein KY290_002825 [Solanum tuberosum]|uniref:Catalase core domain-containing protein n=1 Tax=Solanum tuberosum TaxID=4113 RepID=A0ABQ7WTB1_SOLTU|nr:hypothetical protein KY290_002825 [Solanum tuberosum]
MMEKGDPSHKLYTGMRLWEFPDQYVVEPTDGSCSSCSEISRVDGSVKLIGSYVLVITDREYVGSYFWHLIFKVSLMKFILAISLSRTLLLNRKTWELSFWHCLMLYIGPMVPCCLRITIWWKNLPTLTGNVSQNVLFMPESTPVIVKFSTVIHERGSPETLRDPCGFSVKLYTREGNFDLVGSNFPIILIRYYSKCAFSLAWKFIHIEIVHLICSYVLVITDRECVGSYFGHPIFKVSSMKFFPCDQSLKSSTAEQVDSRFVWNNYMMEQLIDNKLLQSLHYEGDFLLIVLKSLIQKQSALGTAKPKEIYESINYRLASDSPDSLSYGISTREKNAPIGNHRGEKNLVLSAWGDESLLSEAYINPHYDSNPKNLSENTVMNHLSLCQRKLSEDIVDYDLLKDLFSGQSFEWILPLHSSVASEDQKKVFMRPPENIGKESCFLLRKVVDFRNCQAWLKIGYLKQMQGNVEAELDV